MLDIILSKDIRNLLNEIGYEFSDFEKATLIYNRKDITKNQKLKALKELHDSTNDQLLKQQIQERLECEKRNNNDLIQKLEDDWDRFENHYVYIPTNFQVGECVRNMRTNEYSILKTCAQDIQSLLKKAHQNGWKLHYIETTLIGYTLKNDGMWNLEFLELTELERRVLSHIQDVKLRQALESMHDWVIHGYQEDDTHRVMQTTQQYALSLLTQESNTLQRIQNAQDIDEVIRDMI